MAKAIVMERRTLIDSKYAESLLFPVAVFLRAGGVSPKIAMRAFTEAYIKSSLRHKNRQIDHIGKPAQYADIISMWTRDQRFIDSNGRARTLPLRGRNSFSSLVKAATSSRSPRQILAVLTRYGSVRRLKGNRYRLVIPFFFTTAHSRIAFEPAAYFLSDASATLGRLVRRTNKASIPGLFWRKVESTNLSRKTAKEFMGYMRERSVVFLEEIDDWLEAHATRRRSMPAAGNRVGLGLFSYSDFKVGNPRR